MNERKAGRAHMNALARFVTESQLGVSVESTPPSITLPLEYDLRGSRQLSVYRLPGMEVGNTYKHRSAARGLRTIHPIMRVYRTTSTSAPTTSIAQHCLTTVVRITASVSKRQSHTPSQTQPLPLTLIPLVQ